MAKQTHNVDYVLAKKFFDELQQNNFLDCNSLATYLQQKSKLEHNQISLLLRQIDKNNDNRISWPEFVKGFPLISPHLSPSISQIKPAASPKLIRQNSTAADSANSKSIACWIHEAKNLTTLDSCSIFFEVSYGRKSVRTSTVSSAHPEWPDSLLLLPFYAASTDTKIVAELRLHPSGNLIGKAQIELAEVSSSESANNARKDIVSENGKRVGELHLSLMWVENNKKADEWALPRGLRKEWRAIRREVERLTTIDFNRLAGSVKNANVPLLSKVVRIFTSSTFTDTAKERNLLMSDVYPYLNEQSKGLGLAFEVVDMRWGVREFSTDDHLTGFLCMKELEKCLRRSVGPAFINLLGDKVPIRQDKFEKVWDQARSEELAQIRAILAQDHPAETQQIISIVESVPLKDVWKALEQHKLSALVEKDVLLIPRWFILDTNATPPVYALQSISKFIPDFLSRDNSVGGPARGRWWGIFERLQYLLRYGAERSDMDEHDKQPFFISVTEEEVHNGILKNSGRNKQSLCFRRSIPGIEKAANSNPAKYRDWIDVSGNAIDAGARTLLLQLKNSKVPLSGLSSERIFDFEIDLIDDAKATEAYLRQFCDLFCKLMMESIISSFKEQHILIDELTAELIHHHQFRERKTAAVCQSPDLLPQVLHLFERSAGVPIVVYGRSGSGKTTLVACSINEIHSRNPNAVIVYRFIGTSIHSTDLHSVLRSVCEQIKAVYRMESLVIPTSLKDLINTFQNLMLEEYEQRVGRPLYVILDSLDQFHGSQDLRWIPTMLAGGTHVLVSLLPELADILKSRISDAEAHLSVSDFDSTVAKDTLHSWLKMANREITPGQEDLLLGAFMRSPIPLYLRIATDFALGWNSYTPLNEIYLGATVRDLVYTIFDRLERKHGKILVSRALSVITAARQGISAKNIEDILSCDDDVLNDVYQWWTPPIRRLPPLLWKRIRDDLEGYLIESGSLGTEVYRWYHRQFIEAATSRYLSDEQTRRMAHSKLADYFSGDRFLERLVDPQPLHYAETTPNLHKLSELPYHQTFSSLPTMEDALSTTLYDFHFLETKAESGMWEQLDEDFVNAVAQLTDPRAREFKRWYNQAKANLLLFPNQALQSALHWPDSSFVWKKAEAQRKDQSAHSYKDLIFWRQKPQQLNPVVMALGEHSNYGRASAFSPDGEIFVTGSADCTAIVWETKSERKLHTLEHPCEVKIVAVSHDGRYLLANFHLWELKTGKLIHQFEGDERSATVGMFSADDTHILTGEMQGKPMLWNILSKTLVHALPHCEDDLCSVDNAALSSDGNYIATGSFDFRLWNAKTGENILQYTEESCHSCAFSPDNLYVIAGLNSGSIIQFELSTGKIIKTLQGHSEYVDCLEITSDSKRFVTSGDTNIKVWDATTGECLSSWQAHERKVYKIGIAPNQKIIVSIAQYEMSAHVWDFQGNRLKTLVGHTMQLRSIAISPDSEHLVTTSSDSFVRLWDLTSLDSNPTTAPPHPPDMIIFCKLSSDGKSIVSASEDGTMKVWDFESHQIKFSLPHPNEISSCTLFSKGHYVLSKDKEGVIRVWDFSQGILVHSLPVVASINKLSSDDSILLVLTKEGIIQNWEPLSWKLRWEVESGVKEPRTLSISNQNKYFAFSARTDFKIFMRAIEDGQLLRSFEGHTEMLDYTSFSLQDDYLLSGARDGMVKVWRSSDGILEKDLLKSFGMVYAGEISPCGTFLLTAGEDQTLRIWNMKDWSLLKSLTIGLVQMRRMNVAKWISKDQLMIQTPDAIIIYNLTLGKVTGSWFHSVIQDADSTTTILPPHFNSSSNNNNNSRKSDILHVSLTAGTNSGDVFSFILQAKS